ncbi:BF3164 family lipoprotein [Aquiflexum sp.]|uniref:BF3164 family lipoprotein n=1 Tax=Aquiflexum sp. TaxID=1872584 RepID=UPI00359467C3
MKKIIVKYFVLLLITFVACKNNEVNGFFPETDIFFMLEDIEEEYLTSLKYKFEDILFAENIIIKNNFLIIGERFLNENQNPIHLISLDNLVYNRALGNFGFGPEELSDTWNLSSGLNENTFWVFSGQNKVFSEFSLNTFSNKPIKQIKQKEDLVNGYELSWSLNGTIVGRSINDNNIFVEFDSTGKKINGYGMWSEVFSHKNLNSFLIESLHSGVLRSNVDKNIYVQVGVNRDFIKILDKNNETIVSINGPNNRIPDFDIISSPMYGPMLSVNRKEPINYIEAYVSDNFIYVLYSGKTPEEIRLSNEHAFNIFVFDFSGDIKYFYKLDESIRSFVVDEEMKKLYGLTTNDKYTLAIFNLPS